MRISDWSSDVCSSDLLVERPADLSLLCRSVAVADGEVVVGDAEPRGELGVVGVVAHDGGQLDRQLSRAPPVEDVPEAVRLLRRANADAQAPIRAPHRPPHPVLTAHGGKTGSAT